MQNSFLRLWEFIKKHKLLFIGIVLYILMYIVSQNFNPWADDTEYKNWAGVSTKRIQTDVLDTYISDLNIENRFLDKLPLSILYFGISDVAEAVHNNISVLFALITYSSLAMNFFFKKYYTNNEFIKMPERWAINHLYDNVLFYLLSILIKFLQPAVDKIADNADKLFNLSSSGSNIAIKILVLVLFLLVLAIGLLGVFIPMLPSILYFFGYIIAFKYVKQLITFIDLKCFAKVFGDTLFPREFLSFVAAFLIVIAVNIILEQIYELIQRLSLKPAELTAKGIKKGVLHFADKIRTH